MVALCVVLTILTFLTLDYIVERAKAAKRSVATAPRVARDPRPNESFAVAPDTTPAVAAPGSLANARPAGLFLARGHVWAELTPEGTFWLGFEPLAALLLGSAEEIEHAPPGTRVTRGAPLATIRCGGRAIALRAPFAGTVTENNMVAARNPRLLLAEPYGAGRICRIEPDDLEESLRSMRAGVGARPWMREELTRVRDALAAAAAGLRAQALGETLADGGVPIEAVAENLDAASWTRVAAAIEGRSTPKLGAHVEEQPS